MNIDTKFIQDNTPTVKGILQRKNVPESELEDLIQDVFEKAILYQDYYDAEQGSVQTWLGLLCTHVYDRYLRALKPTVELDTSDDSTEAMKLTEEDLLYNVNDHFYDANKEEVDYYLGMLPDGQRDKLYLHLVLGYSHREIAEKLLITEHSSRQLVSVAMKNLRALVASKNPEGVKLHEPKLLKPYGDKSYSGDWAWRLNESLDRSHGPVKVFTPDEVKAYCRERNLQSVYD